MSAEENLAIVRSYLDQVWNEGQLDRFEEFISKDIIPGGSAPFTGAEGMKQSLAAFRNAFPDVSIVTDDEFAVDDKVAGHGPNLALDVVLHFWCVLAQDRGIERCLFFDTDVSDRGNRQVCQKRFLPLGPHTV